MNSKPPAIVEVTRGAFVESVHVLDIVVADADGTIVDVWGDQSRKVFPRSAIKALQALPLVESGAADAFGFGSRHLALACASHNGQPMHVSTAREMIEKSGLHETCLECGAQLPDRTEDQAALFTNNINASAIHNNCSGKHSGFMAFAKFTGKPVKNYIRFDSPAQKEIAGVLESVLGAPHGADNYAIDGCSIPTYTVPLDKLAVAFANFGIAKSGSALRSDAMRRIRDACLECPEMVAGDHRVCTRLMQALGKRAFVKVGAEGVYTASLPELGFGIALKAQDGNPRAAEVAVSSLIASLLELNESEAALMAPLVNPVLRNRNGMEVGSIRMDL